jgi:hypothetical protein
MHKEFLPAAAAGYPAVWLLLCSAACDLLAAICSLSADSTGAACCVLFAVLAALLKG